MTTLAPARRVVKPARPFGEGILPPEPPAGEVLEIRGRFYVARPLETDGTPAVRVAAMDDAGAVYDVALADGELRCTCADFEFRHAGNGTRCKHGAAVAAAGLIDAPAPAVADAIPAKYGRIRIIDGARAGVYARVTDRPGFAPHWAPESGDAGWLSEMDADRLYVAGRVAILEAPKAEAPAPSPEPTAPAPTGRVAVYVEGHRRKPFTSSDLAWAAGYDASLESECPVDPPAGLSPAEAAAWRSGADAAGELVHARIRDAALEAEWSERAEAGLSPLAPWPLD